MSTQTEILRWLESRKGHLPAIARESGVNIWTIRSFVSRRTKNLRGDNLEALETQMAKDASAQSISSSDRLQP